MKRMPARLKRLLPPVVLLAALGIVVFLSISPSCQESRPPERVLTTAAEQRPARWAVPLQRPGLPNLYEVSDTLYRGAQPTAEGFRELKKMGVRTVVNLRSGHSDRLELAGTALGYVDIPMNVWDPDEEEILEFLRVAMDPARTPVFVHCEHGADRTGTACAAYRVAVEGWSVEEAVDEMVNGGFGFHRIWRERLSRCLRRLGFEEIKREAGVGSTVSGG